MLQVHLYQTVNFHMVLIKNRYFPGSGSVPLGHVTTVTIKVRTHTSSHTSLITSPANQGPFQQIFSRTFQLQTTITRLFLPSCCHTFRPSHTHSTFQTVSRRSGLRPEPLAPSPDGSPSFSRTGHRRRVSCHQQDLIKPNWVELPMSATMQLAII